MRKSKRPAASFEESIVSVFEGYPSLCGFSVQHSPGLPDGGSEPLDAGLFLLLLQLVMQKPELLHCCVSLLLRTGRLLPGATCLRDSGDQCTDRDTYGEDREHDGKRLCVGHVVSVPQRCAESFPVSTARR